MADNFQEIEREFKIAVEDMVRESDSKAQRCAVRAANAMRNAALNVLRGQRSGKVYKKPYSQATYTASAPGEPPAVRTGTLRISWGIKAEHKGQGKITVGIYTRVPYAELLEKGTSRVSARPYKDAIIEKAKPQIKRIFSELAK